MGWYRERVRVMEFLSDTVVDILARTQKILERCRQEYPEWPALALAGEVAASSHAAKDIATKVRQTRQWLERPQPPLNAEMIRHSQEALDRGEGEEISDLIARIEAEGPLVKE